MRPRPRLRILLPSVALPAVVAAQGTSVRPSVPPPIAIVGRHASLIVGTPAAIVAASDSASVVRALTKCLPSSRDSAEIAHGTAPAGTGMTDQADYLLVAIVPASAYLSAACDTRILAGPALLARGIQYAAANGYDARSDLMGATILARGRRVDAADVERMPARVVPAPPDGARAPSWLVIAIPAAALAPDAAGRFPDVTIRTATVDTSGADGFTLSAEQLRALWYQLIPVRLGTSPAAVAALARANAPRAERDALRTARIELATAALAAGDTAAARVVLRDVLSDAPCLTMAADRDRFDRLIDAMRPPARCTVIAARHIIARGVVPGLALFTVGRPGSGATNAVATLGVAAVGAGFDGAARQWRAKYLTARSPADAIAAYDRAADNRRLARTALEVAGGVWVSGVVHALLVERAYGRELARVRDYDPHARVGLLATPHGALAMGVSVQW